MKIEDIKKVDWYHALTRDESLLFQSITVMAHRHFKEVAKIDWDRDHELRTSKKELLYSLKEVEWMKDYFYRNGTKSMIDFKKRLIFYVTKLGKKAEEISFKNYEKISDEKLLKIAEDFFELALKTHNFLLPLPLADQVLTKLLLENISGTEEEKKKYLFILTYPKKDNSHFLEEKSFLNLVFLYNKKDKKFNNALKKHLQDFSWIGARGYWFEREWKENDLLNRIKIFIKEGKDPKKEAKKLDNFKKSQASKFEKLIKELKIKNNSKLFNLINLSKELAYLRTWRSDIVYRSGFWAKNLFYEMARRSKIGKQDIFYLTFKELLETFRNKKLIISKEELKRRKKKNIFVNIGKEFKVFSKSEEINEIESAIKKEKITEKKVIGSVAFKGKVVGIVKVIKSSEELDKIKSGDVLVAIMTFPNYIAAMEKASAFVTDEGGILCHAAIVAREMSKPCIIATKIATKVLHDGDLVEVDADKGVVKIIKKK